MTLTSRNLAGPALLTLSLAGAGLAAQAPPQKLVPAPVSPSDLTVRLERVGKMPSFRNPTSPASAGSYLLLLDQAGSLYAWKDGEAAVILDTRSLPRDIKPLASEPVLNAAFDPKRQIVYVLFVSASAPANIPRRQSPRPQSDGWYVLYAFSADETMKLGTPRAVTALQVRSEGHTGGGLAVLPDGTVLIAPGDNGDSYEDGGTYSQDPEVHLSKIVRVDPATGAVTVVAVGVRAAQRLVVTGDGADALVSFVDPGGWVSEELNTVAVSALVGGGPPVNFGWGRAADGRSREGTFFIDRVGNSTERIAAAESGFVDPVTEIGRGAAPFIAISGPVTSAPSFSRIAWLFGDLVRGAVFATTGSPRQRRQTAFAVTLKDSANQTVTLQQLAGGSRPDPRFFTFPDGSAGVLLERTGEFFRLVEVR